MSTAKPKRGLGKGLSALIPDSDMDFLSRVARGDAAVETVLEDSSLTILAEGPSADTKPPAKGADAPAGERPLAELVDVEAIEANPYQPRRVFSPQEMEELVASIEEHGIIQPLLVRPLTDAADDAVVRYQLVAGERRWRAAKSAGLAKVPAIVRPLADQQALELALIENVQRHDISPLDAALAYRRLLNEFALTQDDVARRVGKSRSAVANTLRLLDLPAEVQKAIEGGTLSEGHGRAILLAPDDSARRAVLRQVIRENLSVRETENLARRLQEQPEKRQQKASGSQSSPEVAAIEQALQKRLSTRVSLKTRRQGGQIVIQYFSNEELERLLKLIAE